MSKPSYDAVALRRRIEDTKRRLYLAIDKELLSLWHDTGLSPCRVDTRLVDVAGFGSPRYFALNEVTLELKL